MDFLSPGLIVPAGSACWLGLSNPSTDRKCWIWQSSIANHSNAQTGLPNPSLIIHAGLGRPAKAESAKAKSAKVESVEAEQQGNIINQMRDQLLSLFPRNTYPLILVSDPDGLLTDESVLAALIERGFTIIQETDSVLLRYRIEQVKPFQSSN